MKNELRIVGYVWAFTELRILWKCGSKSGDYVIETESGKWCGYLHDNEGYSRPDENKRMLKKVLKALMEQIEVLS